MSEPAPSWPPPRIETARLLLRPPVYDDGPSLHAVLGDPEVCRFLPYPATASLALTRRAIALWAAAAGTGVTTYAVCLRTAIGRPFGLVQAQRKPGEPDVELGVMLASSTWGGGFAGEAMTAIRLAAPLFLPVRLWAGVDAENRRAIAMLARIGLAPSASDAASRVHPALSPDKRDCVVFEQRLPVRFGS